MIKIKFNYTLPPDAEHLASLSSKERKEWKRVGNGKVQCTIQDCDGPNENYEINRVFIGESKTASTDRFIKPYGRKLAFKQAVASIEDKPTRRAAWAELKRMSPATVTATEPKDTISIDRESFKQLLGFYAAHAVN